METNDMPAFAQIMAGLGELYGKPVSEALIELYWIALKRFDIANIRQAVNMHINNPDAGQFMLKPADIVRYLEGNANTKALQAWTKVIHAMRQVGHYDSVVFDDLLIHAVIYDMGGWVEFCKVTEKDLSFRAREFEKRYECYLIHKPMNYPKQLTGLIDANNVARGFKANPPFLIGDEKLASQVYLSGKDNNQLSQYKSLSLDLKDFEKTEIKLLDKQDE